MPIYEYQCSICGFVFEEISKFDPVKIYRRCPRCKEKGKDVLAFKIFSPVNFNIKGFSAKNGYTKTKGE
jgi:putative FmdB family regulatory protein